MGSYRLVMDEIHVLLVDHESQDLNNAARLLEMNLYKVTRVELASLAIKMLLRGKAKFDVIMANINSPDLHGFSLLQHAVNMDIPIILMSTDDNTTTAKRAIEGGACLCMKKPATMEMLSFLWQHVLREKTRTTKEADRSTTTNNSEEGTKYEEMVHNLSTDMFMMKENGKSKEKSGERKRHNSEEEYNSENDGMINNKNKKRVCMEWTEELHQKFVDAVEELGEGRCFPKYILEIMNVPGLTRMQVASHLQKCRNNSWRPHKQQKSSSTTQHVSSNTDGSQRNARRMVPKPRLGKVPTSHGEPNDGKNEHMRIRGIVIHTSHKPQLDDTKPRTNSSDLGPPPGFEQKFGASNMDTEDKRNNHE